MRRRRNFVPRKVPSRLARTPRVAATGKYVYPKTLRYPIGDLYHAREALIYVLSPTNAKSRKTVAKAVQKAYPEYNWAAWWNERRKGKKGVQTWHTLIGKKTQRKNPKRESCRAGDGSFVPVPACRGRVQSVMLFFHEMKAIDPKFTLQDAWNIAKGIKPETKLTKKTIKAAEKIAPVAAQLALPLANSTKNPSIPRRKNVTLKGFNIMKRYHQLRQTYDPKDKEAAQKIVQQVAQSIPFYSVGTGEPPVLVRVRIARFYVEYENKKDAQMLADYLATMFDPKGVKIRYTEKRGTWFVRFDFTATVNALGLTKPESYESKLKFPRKGIQNNPKRLGKSTIEKFDALWKNSYRKSPPDFDAIERYLRGLADTLIAYNLSDTESLETYVVYSGAGRINFYFIARSREALDFAWELTRMFGRRGVVEYMTSLNYIVTLDLQAAALELAVATKFPHMGI